MPSLFTIGDLARRYGLRAWQVRAIYERGLLPEPARLRSYRVVTEAQLPEIERALRTAGYLSDRPEPMACR